MTTTAATSTAASLTKAASPPRGPRIPPRTNASTRPSHPPTPVCKPTIATLDTSGIPVSPGRLTEVIA